MGYTTTRRAPQAAFGSPDGVSNGSAARGYALSNIANSQHFAATRGEMCNGLHDVAENTTLQIKVRVPAFAEFIRFHFWCVVDDATKVGTPRVTVTGPLDSTFSDNLPGITTTAFSKGASPLWMRWISFDNDPTLTPSSGKQTWITVLPQVAEHDTYVEIGVSPYIYVGEIMYDFIMPSTLVVP